MRKEPFEFRTEELNGILAMSSLRNTEKMWSWKRKYQTKFHSWKDWTGAVHRELSRDDFLVYLSPGFFLASGY